jgi:lysophospholipid acyltransferase (LPLAT)-like uncharacterized protein
MKVTPRRARWLGRLGALVLTIAGSTWRIRMHGHLPDLSRSDHLVAFLHGDMVIPAVLWRRIPAAVMISQHGDGELIAQVVRRLGRHVPIRGSSTRGGARAFLEIVRGRSELGWAITPDGPRGPRGTVHDGVILLGSEAQRPITPVGFAVSRAWRLRSWDRFVIPWPFARITGYLGEPLPIPVEVDRETRAALANELKSRMSVAEECAVEALANW